MSKKDVFGKNKNRLVKKAVIYIIVMILIVAAFVPIVSSCHIPPGDGFCEEGVKPCALTMLYTGEDCSASSHHQDPKKVKCNGDPAFTDPVHILATDKKNPDDPKAKIWFDGIADLNAEFVINATNAGETKLKASTHVFIYNATDGTLLQTIEFHTSCSQPLFEDDQFGSLKLKEFIPESECECEPEDEYTLTINYEGNGTVTKNPDQPTYTYGTVVELTAIADSGWTFDHWSGDLSGSSNPATISMTGDKTVTATFTEDQYTLTINIVGNGNVAKDPNQSTYTYGTLVELTATADPGWTFDHWSGDLSGSSNPATISMTGDKTVTDTFTEGQYTLTININGSGNVSKDPGQETYTYGTLVNFTATADPGWTFDHWDGDLSGSENPENITMDGNKTVIANFSEIEDEDEDEDDGEEEGEDNGDNEGDEGNDDEEDEQEDEEEDDEEDNNDSTPTPVIRTSSSNSYPGNSPPVANASGPYYGVIDKEIEFDGSGSYDLDGTITHYGWSFGDGNTGYGEVVKHTYSNSRSYLVTLAISDNNGATDIDKTIAYISVPNNPPSIPMISGPNGSKDTKYSYAFGSTDPDNDDINYIINWGDNTINESGFLPSGHYFSMLHSWAKSGEYDITVTASDNQSTSSSEMTVLIEENIVMDNIAIVVLGILALIALLISLLYIKKGKKRK